HRPAGTVPLVGDRGPGPGRDRPLRGQHHGRAGQGDPARGQGHDPGGGPPHHGPAAGLLDRHHVRHRSLTLLTYGKGTGDLRGKQANGPSTPHSGGPHPTGGSPPPPTPPTRPPPAFQAPGRTAGRRPVRPPTRTRTRQTTGHPVGSATNPAA